MHAGETPSKPPCPCHHSINPSCSSCWLLSYRCARKVPSAILLISLEFMYRLKFKSLILFGIYLGLYQSTWCLLPQSIASCPVEVGSMVLVIVSCPENHHFFKNILNGSWQSKFIGWAILFGNPVLKIKTSVNYRPGTFYKLEQKILLGWVPNNFTPGLGQNHREKVSSLKVWKIKRQILGRRRARTWRQ